MKNIGLYLIAFIMVTMYSCSQKSGVVGLKNKTSEVIFSKDLKSIQSYKKVTREYISEKSAPLYNLKFGSDYSNVLSINSYEASKAKVLRQTDRFIEIEYTHAKEQMQVTCLVRTEKNDSLLYWSIKVSKKSPDTLALISYPQIACSINLGNDTLSDAIVYPVNEGVLLTGMAEKGAAMNVRYPGKLSSQMMYNFDVNGGLLYASFDGMGYPKNLDLKNDSSSVIMSQEFVMPIHPIQDMELPYEVTTGLFGGRWEAGADVYRNWSDTQEWTRKRIDERFTADWLKKPNLFLNSSFANQSMSVDEVNEMIQRYHDFYDIPVVTAVFSWEKNGTWIGPDYFPPHPSTTFYNKLTQKLTERGDHLHFYTSGFRWGVKKPVNEKDEIPRVYTDFDGHDYFKKHGEHLAVMESNGNLLMQKPRWADNYYMCVGHNDSHAVLENVYNKIYAMGVAGVDLDQNLGGESEDCFHPDHSHSKGGGLWQTHAMEYFLSTIAQKNLKDGNTFQGVEETCERFAHLFDIYHGRAFTDTNWPVYGPGAVSIPLYIYLYHEYQMGYAGWIDGGFSPSNYIKYGLGRSFIFGMMPGVRVNRQTELNKEVTDELLMLKSFTELLKKYPDYLLKGRMYGEVAIKGAKDFVHYKTMDPEVPVHWSSVQGIRWKNVKNNKQGIALANMLDQAQDIQIDVSALGANHLQITGYSNGKISKDLNIDVIDGSVKINSEPWELIMITQP